jgi:hypothetical protein
MNACHQEAKPLFISQAIAAATKTRYQWGHLDSPLLDERLEPEMAVATMCAILVTQYLVRGSSFPIPNVYQCQARNIFCYEVSAVTVIPCWQSDRESLNLLLVLPRSDTSTILKECPLGPIQHKKTISGIPYHRSKVDRVEGIHYNAAYKNVRII